MRYILRPRLPDDALLVVAGTSVQVVAGVIRGEIDGQHVYLDTPVKVIALITKVHDRENSAKQKTENS